MNIYLVYYDLQTAMSYTAFYALVDVYDHCWVSENHYLIRTNGSAEGVRKKLNAFLGEKDTLIVTNYDGNLINVGDEAKEWLQSKIGKVY